MYSRLGHTLGSILVPALLLAATPAGATVADDLCPAAADPCVFGGTLTVAPGSLLDFGSRAVQLSASARLTVASSFTVRAGSFRMLPGARITGTSDISGANVRIETAGDLALEASGNTRARIDVSAGEAPGLVDLVAGGSIAMAGALIANGINTFAGDGFVNMIAGANVLLDGDLQLKGASEGGGGSLFVSAPGTVEVLRPIDLSGGDVGGGDFDVQAGGDVTVRAQINVNGGGLSGDGGTVSLLSGGSIALLGGITGEAAGDSEDGGGSGADVDLFASQSVTIGTGLVSITGAFPDGQGGAIIVDAGTDVTFGVPVIAFGNGIDGCGGFVDIAAGRDVSLARVDLNGGGCGGGRLGVVAQGTVTLGQQITADGSTQFGSGGSVQVTATRALMVNGVVRANGSDVSPAGTITLQSCTLNVTSPAELRTQGLGGTVELRASGQLTVAGDLVSDGANRFVRRDASVPVAVTGSVSPVAIPLLDPLLPACPPSGAACGDGTTDPGEECDDANTGACDGCSPSCRLERCGNARVECAEQCDLGSQNGLPGVGCDASCQVVQVGGGIQMIPGGRNRNDCFLEWAVRNPGGEVVDGFPSSTQRCIDGDPSCDTDEANDGTCTFSVASCLAVTDARLPLCQPPPIDLVTIHVPHPLKATLAADVTNAQTLVGAIGDLGVSVRAGGTILRSGQPDPLRDHCSDPFDIVVPHGPGVQGSKTLSVEARAVGGVRMTGNSVSLVCAPNTAVCGNGVVEIGERCDDANQDACDGCTPTCRVEACGNGVVECSEQCDDGPDNGTPASECTAECTELVPPLRVPGGGSKTLDCLLETALAMGTPTVDGRGLPSKKQTCVDGDPTCDFDPAAGVCGMRAWACLGGADPRIGCLADVVATTEVRKPSVRDFGPLAALRQALVSRLAALGSPVGPGERCSRRIDVPVPVGRKGVSLQLRVASPAGSRDTDSLKLRCQAPEP